MFWKLFWLFGAIYNTGASIHSYTHGYIGISMFQCICAMSLFAIFLFFGLVDYLEGKGFWK